MTMISSYYGIRKIINNYKTRKQAFEYTGCYTNEYHKWFNGVYRPKYDENAYINISCKVNPFLR